MARFSHDAQEPFFSNVHGPSIIVQCLIQTHAKHHRISSCTAREISVRILTQNTDALAKSQQKYKGNRLSTQDKTETLEELSESFKTKAEIIGNALVMTFHYLALFAIGYVIIWAAVLAFLKMTDNGHINIDDVLLLFIYLELLSMIGIYFQTNHMPVRYLILCRDHRLNQGANY